MDSKLSTTYTNPAWDQFARDNDGSDLTADAVNGTNIFQVIPRILRPFYTRVFDEVRSRAEIWQHIYQCSGPQRFGKFRMRVHLLNPNWLMVSNTLLIEADLGWKAPAHDFVYSKPPRADSHVRELPQFSTKRRSASVGFLRCPPESPSGFSWRTCWPLPHLSRLFLSADSVPKTPGQQVNPLKSGIRCIRERLTQTGHCTS